MKKIKRNIPNAITCGNLFCGCLATVKAFEGDLVLAAYLVGIAAVLDFFDGFIARLLKVSSPIGKDLDSLADMVTFGVVPGFVMFKLLLISTVFMSNTAGWKYIPYLAFIIPVFSAIRLAKFNNDVRQKESFIGVNTPANSILICSLPLIIGVDYQSPSALFILNPYLLVAITIIMSALLVSEIPIFSFKFKSFGWKGNEIRFVFILLSLVLLITLQFMGIPLIIVLYIGMSIINNFLTKNETSKSKQA
ncbi:MAG TPA: CDP-alcohol phosphatidyltransferase family protein [Bacteroidia bacterium]